jgi:hypothetical protein
VGKGLAGDAGVLSSGSPVRGRGTHEAKRVPTVVHRDRLAVGHLTDHLRRRRQVVHDEVDPVVLLDPLGQEGSGVLGELDAARDLEVALAHENVVRRVLDHRAVQNLAQVLDSIRNRLRLAKRQRVVVVRQLRLGAGELVHLDIDSLVGLVLAHRHARQVEAVRSMRAEQHQRKNALRHHRRGLPSRPLRRRSGSGGPLCPRTPVASRSH